jgi:glycerate 2-kinase
VTTQLVDDARACLLAAIRAADARTLTARVLLDDGELTALLAAAGRTWIIAAGKAAFPMALGACDVLGSGAAGGVVVIPTGSPGKVPDRFETFRGGHPYPNDEGARGAARIADIAQDLDRSDVMLCLLSGGASALTTLPPNDLSLADVSHATRLLMEAGASIDELNTVRKHFDRLKGGQLATLAAPATVVGLLLSDVVGDRVDVIGSGPLVADPTTYQDALGVVAARGIGAQIPAPVMRHLERGANGELPETPKLGDQRLAAVHIRVIGNNALAIAGARREAAARGYVVDTLPSAIEGEARDAGALLARSARERRMAGAKRMCMLGGGETTVTVHGRGRGGRNQELAAAAALEVDGEPGIAVGSIGTDGIDGPTDAAGAIIDGDTVRLVRDRGGDLRRALDANDSYTALDLANALVRTGPTGTNVMDVQIVLTW